MSHLAAVREIEWRSELNLFWQLPDAEEEVMEGAEDLAWAQSWVN
jgi:hypothetical protein